MGPDPRIVIVGPAHPYRGGQALVESHLFQLLSAMGYACHTISFSLLYPSLLFPGTTQFDESDRRHSDHSDRIERIINSINPVSWWRAARRIRDLDPAVVVFIWWMPFFGPALGTIARLVKRWTGARVVFLVENYISHEQRWFDHALTRMTLRQADQFISESGFVSERLVEGIPGTPVEQVTLPVYDCYDFGRFDRGQARDHLGITARHVVLFFGYIKKYKGLQDLIRAFPRILARHPDTQLLIVGECYGDRRIYDDLLAEHGLTDRTIFVDSYVPNEEIEVYFKAADLVCLPYIEATQSGIIMLSYGFRRPVVATRVGGLPELVREGETGFLVPPQDESALAAGVAGALDAAATTDFAANIDAYVESLGYARLEELFRRLTEVDHG